MSRQDRRERWMYAVLIFIAFAAVALWRLDLFLEAWRATRATFGAGGSARWRLIGEIALFGGILTATLWTIPSSVRPAHDLTVFLLAGFAGWLVELWGTHLGLWRYYTGEQPPLWIVPAWPLGAAMIDRLAARFRIEFGPSPEPMYWLLGAAALGIALRFCGPALGHAVGWAIPALVFASIVIAPTPSEDFWLLVVGMGAVFFADLWGVTNGCWSYDLHGRPGGPAWGIAFGMALDASTILLCLRLARGVRV